MENKELCYLLDNQLERLVQKGDITPGELDSIYKAVKTKYYLTVIKEMENAGEFDEYGYSGRRMSISYDGRPSFNSYDNSYEGRSSARGRDSMGRYSSRDGGYSSREGGFSGTDEMRHHLEMAMNAAKTEQERQNIRNMMNNM